MGQPFNEMPPNEPPPSPHPDPASSSEEDSGSDGTRSGSDDRRAFHEGEGGYPFSSDDSEEWEDPSQGGILTLVFRATEHGDESELAQLIPSLSVPINTPGQDSDTALHLAALYGHMGCARLLLQAGARADLPDDDGAVPLHDAAAGGYRELAELLMEHAPDCVNATDGDGDTPLHNAARGGFTDVLRFLLSQGADPSVRNNDFLKPALLASEGTDARRLLEEAEEEALTRAAANGSDESSPGLELS